MSRPPAGRLVALFALMAFSFGAISVRLVVLQVSQAQELQDRAFDQRVRTIDLPAQRGQILDRNGARLALSTPADDVYADPQLVDDPWRTATLLSPLLGVGVPDLVRAMTSEGTFVYLARHLGRGVSDRIQRLALPGIGLLPTSKRSYPAGSLASQVLGFVGTDGVGLTGLELGYQDVLAGTPGERTNELGLSGQAIVSGVDEERAPVAGANVVTTIDRELQFQAQTALEQAVDAQGARGGTVIVMDPRSAEVLAMASDPSFDPNAFEDAPSATYRNRAVTDAYEPGSTNKVITAAAAIQERAIPLDLRLTVPWTMPVGDYVIHDSQAHAPMQMTLGDIVAESSNIGAVMVADRVGASTLATYLARFGLGRATGVGFPGESNGIILPLDQWNDTILATTAYGQGIAATPLQMVSVFSTIANDGRWVQPKLVRGTIGPDGSLDPIEAAPTRRVVSAGTARMVTRMLAYAVQDGTGTNAQIPGYQVAGKTGTARIPTGDGSGYLDGQYIASFIGFLPAGDPKVVVAAILDRPATVYGGLAAAPLFKRVALAAIARLDIAPADRVPLPPHALPTG
ncbi:MAG TPA: penicillin-binding protein 2 [Actinomycetota bacterium]|nr:penicillin-binding protein 2 [Actinomycetota bacterium]